jgi:hypothetical protein
MAIYNAYVETCHGMRCYQVAAVSEDAAKREAGEYGRVRFVHRVCACHNG